MDFNVYDLVYERFAKGDLYKPASELLPVRGTSSEAFFKNRSDVVTQLQKNQHNVYKAIQYLREVELKRQSILDATNDNARTEDVPMTPTPSAQLTPAKSDGKKKWQTNSTNKLRRWKEETNKCLPIWKKARNE